MVDVKKAFLRDFKDGLAESDGECMMKAFGEIKVRAAALQVKELILVHPTQNFYISPILRQFFFLQARMDPAILNRATSNLHQSRRALQV